MCATYKSLSTNKKLVFSPRFKDGKTRVYIENTEFCNEPLYTIPSISSKSIILYNNLCPEIKIIDATIAIVAPQIKQKIIDLHFS